MPKPDKRPQQMDDSFWSRVIKSDGCWEWTASRDKDGYGRLQVGDKWCAAHRVSWEIYNGPIPNGLCVLHTCDNPPCVNPAHLWIGTQLDNVADRQRKGRGPDTRGEKHGGAKLTECDVIEIRARYDAGGVSQQNLGESFGVTRETIGGIVRRQEWTHI